MFKGPEVGRNEEKVSMSGVHRKMERGWETTGDEM